MKKLHMTADVSILLLIGVLVTTFSEVAGSDPPAPQSSVAAAPQPSTAAASAPQLSAAAASAPQLSAAATPQSSAPGSAISSMCASTDHKDLCHDTLSSSNATDDPIELIKAAFKAVVDHIQDASKIRDDMEKKANDPLNQAALSDCKELLQYAVEELEAAISDVTGKEVHTLGDRVHELLNWLSAVISYTETCKDGIEHPEIKSEMEKGLVNATALTSNALAIVTGIDSILSAFHLPNISSIFSRRLLEENSGDVHQIDADGYPTWLSTSDRKLLALNHHGGGANPKPNVVVAQDGSGDFKTISDALNAMPKKSKSRYVIHVKAGLYKENVIVTKDMVNVFMYGDGPRKSIVTGSKNWKDGTPTFQTATFAAIGDGFIAKEMGFQNTAGPEKHQAVALRVQSDMSAFYNCRMDGYQDTLYAQAKRQFYRSCLISGTIDFIFGDSPTLLQNCKIVVRKPMDKQYNTVTAQGRKDKREITGIVLQHCRIIPEEKLYPDRLKVLTYLGRPWKEYSVTVIMESFLDDLIQPEGWKEWDGDFAINTLLYAEYGNEGPGSNTDKRVKWPGVKVIKDRKEAAQYTAEKFLNGNLWLKDTGVPHILSLTK